MQRGNDKHKFPPASRLGDSFFLYVLTRMSKSQFPVYVAGFFFDIDLFNKLVASLKNPYTMSRAFQIDTFGLSPSEELEFNKIFKEYVFQFLRLRVLITRRPQGHFHVKNCGVILFILKLDLLAISPEYLEYMCSIYEVY